MKTKSILENLSHTLIILFVVFLPCSNVFALDTDEVSSTDTSISDLVAPIEDIVPNLDKVDSIATEALLEEEEISIITEDSIILDEDVVSLIDTSTSTDDILISLEEEEETSTTTDTVTPIPESLGVDLEEKLAPASVLIHLRIESATTTLFNDSIDVSACSASDLSTSTVSGYCAVKQSGLSSEWSSFGDDQFLSSINGVENDYTNNDYWGWFSDLEYGQTSLLKHLLVPDESLLVVIGRTPLKLSVGTTTPYVGSTTTASIFSFGFDDSWNGVWLPESSSSIEIGGEVYSADEHGQYDIAISTTTPFIIFASGDSFIESDSIVISPIAYQTTSSSTATTTDTIVTNTNSTGGGNNNDDDSNVHKDFDVESAIQFLLSKQKSDGSFGAGHYSDWAAIALVAGEENEGREKLVSFLKTADDSLSSVTDYERRAMALMALDVNPYNGTSINYIQKIIDNFDGIQIGRRSLVNDDIFAIFPLINAGYSKKDEVIKKTVEFIISKQKLDGSFEGSVDLTAGAIQALSLVSSLSGANQALTNARQYLSSYQQSDGGFGSSFATSWALQAIVSLGESNADWVKNKNTPEDYLSLLQQSDGGVEVATLDENTRIWTTSYAIPAVLYKSWSDILSSFSKPENPTSVLGAFVEKSDTEIIEMSTSTEVIATSTVALSELALFTDLNPFSESNKVINNTQETKPRKQTESEVAPLEEVLSNEQDRLSATSSSQVAGVLGSGIDMSIKNSLLIFLGLAGLSGIFYFYKNNI